MYRHLYPYLYQVVLLDERLCHLILDNALSNAFKHGHPQNPDVRLSIALHETPTRDSALLTATVTNVAHPARPPITPEYLTKVLEGRAPLGPTTSAISDRIGLQHSFLAGATMGANLSLTQAGGQVVFKMQFRVESAAARSSPPPQGSVADDFAAAPFPSGLKICCLDDSEAARRLLYHNLVTHAQTNAVRTFRCRPSPRKLQSKCRRDWPGPGPGRRLIRA